MKQGYNEQAQICAEGCEEDRITHIFQIQCKHKLFSKRVKKSQTELNGAKLIKRDEIGPDGVKRVKWLQLGPNRTKRGKVGLKGVQRRQKG